jgi:hypothetical protein
MKIFALPGSISDPKLELLEAALQGFPFSALPTCGCFLSCELVQVLANKSSQRRVAIDSNFANALDQLFRQGKRDVSCAHKM